MKDDPGSYAVFTEEGSSASQMTAAKVLDVMSRLPGCAGQASDALSAHAQVKMEDAPNLLKFFGIGMSRHLDSITTSSMAKKLAESSRTRCSSREEFVRSPMSRIAVGKPVRKGPDRERMGESSGKECLLVHRQQGLLLLAYVDDIKMARQQNHLQPIWKRWMKQVDLENEHNSWIKFSWDALNVNVSHTKSSSTSAKKKCLDL